MKEVMKDLTIYTIEDLQKLLGLHKLTLQRYAREGRLKATKIGREWVISSDNLRDFLCGIEKEPESMSSYLKRRELLRVA